MKIRAGYEISYDCPQPTPMILQLSVHPSRISDLLTWDRMQIAPSIPVNTYHDSFGNFCHVIRAPAGRLTMSTDFIVQDKASRMPSPRNAQQHAAGRPAGGCPDLSPRQPLLRDRSPDRISRGRCSDRFRKAGRWFRRSATTSTVASRSVTSMRARPRRHSTPIPRSAACAGTSPISRSRCAAA